MDIEDDREGQNAAKWSISAFQIERVFRHKSSDERMEIIHSVFVPKLKNRKLIKVFEEVYTLNPLLLN